MKNTNEKTGRYRTRRMKMKRKGALVYICNKVREFASNKVSQAEIAFHLNLSVVFPEHIGMRKDSEFFFWLSLFSICSFYVSFSTVYLK
jgi:hypothetical protein